MRQGLIASAMALMLVIAAPAVAGDPSGVDEAAMDACVAAAATEGGIVDCAGTGVAACKTFWAGRKPELDAFSVLEGCTDAERQFWDARLTVVYDGLIADTEARRPEEVEAVREMERAWIAFRDARCAAERGLFGHGTGGAIAVPECQMKETARQLSLLTQLRKNE